MSTTQGGTYTVFKRAWWKANRNWPGGLEPNPCARKTTLRRGLTIDEARQFCQEWNRTHKPGRFSVKAEFTQE